jgi:hypothetical protein
MKREPIMVAMARTILNIFDIEVDAPELLTQTCESLALLAFLANTAAKINPDNTDMCRQMYAGKYLFIRHSILLGAKWWHRPHIYGNDDAEIEAVFLETDSPILGQLAFHVPRDLAELRDLWNTALNDEGRTWDRVIKQPRAKEIAIEYLTSIQTEPAEYFAIPKSN